MKLQQSYTGAAMFELLDLVNLWLPRHRREACAAVGAIAVLWLVIFGGAFLADASNATTPLRELYAGQLPLIKWGIPLAAAVAVIAAGMLVVDVLVERRLRQQIGKRPRTAGRGAVTRPY